MPDLALYTNPEIAYAPRINLQVADRALATMEQNHLKTLELQGELESVVNNLELDESENAYKAGLVDDIKRSVEDSTIDGYSGYALSDIVKKYGDIKSNPVLMGKIKANQAHKANDAKLDQMVAKGTITQDTADRFKELNPYYNNVQFDKNGNAIGTDTWEAKINPVADVDMNDIFVQATKYINPQEGEWDNGIMFRYADGTQGTALRQDAIGYTTDSGSFVRITEKQIRDAVNAVFNANPVLKEGVYQGFKTQEWKGKKEGITPDAIANGTKAIPESYSVFNSDGTTKTFDQYLEDAINPFIRAYEKYNTKGGKKYHQFTKSERENLGFGDGTTTTVTDPNTEAIHSAQGIANTPRDKMAGDIYTTVQNVNGQLFDYLANQFPNKNHLDGMGLFAGQMPSSYDVVENYIIAQRGGANNLTDLDKKVLSDLKTEYLLDSEAISQYNESLSIDDKQAAKMIIEPLIMAGQDISSFANSENKYIRDIVAERANAIQYLFGDGNSVTYKTKNKNELAKAIHAMGFADEASAKTAGFIIEGNDIIFNKENSGYIEHFADVLNATNGVLKRENGGKVIGSNVGVFLDNIRPAGDVASPLNIRRTRTSAENYLKSSIKTLNGWSGDIRTSANVNPTLYGLDVEMANGGSIREFSLVNAAEILGTTPEMNRDIKAAQEGVFSRYRNTDIIHKPIWFYDEDGNFYDIDNLTDENGVRLSGEEILNRKKDIEKALRNVKESDMHRYIGTIPGARDVSNPNGTPYTGGLFPVIDFTSTFEIKIKDATKDNPSVLSKEPRQYKIIINDDYGDPALRALNASSTMQASNQIATAKYLGNPVGVGEDSFIQYDNSTKTYKLIEGGITTNNNIPVEECAALRQVWNTIILNRDEIANEFNALTSAIDNNSSSQDVTAQDIIDTAFYSVLSKRMPGVKPAFINKYSDLWFDILNQ